MFQNLCRDYSSIMPVSLSEWRVRIGTFVPRMPLSQYLDLTMKLFLALLSVLADGESKLEPSEKETSPTTTDHQSSSDKTPSNPEKDGTPSGVSSDEQKTPTATTDQTKNRLCKGSKKRKRLKAKGHSGPDQSCGAFLSFRCFLKSGASPLLRFLLLVFTTILLIRSGDVEVNPGPNERATSVSDSTLLDIAKRISQDKLYYLGKNLGIDFSSLRRYRATNTMGGAANWNGTLDMLIDWRDNTPIQQQAELLRNALISSSLYAVAEQYLPQDPPSKEEASVDMQNIPAHPAVGQSTSHGGTNMASSLIGRASSQSHAHSMGLHALPENEEGFISGSNRSQEHSYSNLSGPPAPDVSSLGQTPSCGMAAAQTYPPTGPGSYPVSVQPGRSYMAPQMTTGHPYAPVMSSYHTPQEPTITHSSTAQYLHPASEIPPITDAQLEQCREDIKDFYGRNLCQIPTSPLDTDSLVELKSIFTNLILLKENRSTRKKENLAYKDLLDIKMNNLTAKRIMIQGEAGVGKTTFCAKIAWDWIEGTHYQGYALVAIVPLRDAKNDKTVGQILKTYMSDENKVTSEQLDKYIKEHQDKVLTVLDGFDEFGVEMCNDMNSIVQILNCKSIKSGTVIVTTRPWKAHEIANGMELAKQYAFVRIEGFKKEDVKTYIKRFYQADETSAKSLQEFIEEGSLVSETMAPFPIFCSMLCHMWKEVERREVIRKLQTFSQLFQEMIMLLKRHYVSKHTEAVDGHSVEVTGRQIDDHFQKISKVAFSGLLGKQLVFPEEKFVSCSEDLNVVCEVGLLTKERAQCKRVHGAVKRLAKKESTVSFPHKLFQEYTAGLYLQGLFLSNVEDFNHQMTSKILLKPAEFRYLLYFVGSFHEDIARYILTKLMAQENSKLNFIVEVALECYSEKAANLIEEKHEEINQLLTIKKRSRVHEISGYIFTCKHLVSLCIETFHNSKALSRIIADAVCSLHTLKKLTISCRVPDAFITHVQEHAESVMVESLEIVCTDYRFHLSESASQNLGVSICTMPYLRNLKLVMKLSDEFYTALREGASSLKVESLEIESIVQLSNSASQNLGACICIMPCLNNLKVARGLSDEFCTALRKGASSLKVESLDLSVGGISELGLQSLAASICSMPCLRSVGVDSNSKNFAALKGTLMKDAHKDESSPSLPLSSSSSSSSSSSRIVSSTCQINIKMDVELLIAFVSFLVPPETAKVESLEINKSHLWRHDISKSASHNLGASICTIPCLKNLKLNVGLSDEFYTTLRQGASSLKIEQMYLMGVRLERSDGLSAFALMQNLESLILFDVRISDNGKHTEEEGRHPSDTPSSTSLTELNVDHDSFISLCGMGLLKRFPHIQKMTLAFHHGQTPFPQELLHLVTMPAVMDLTLQGYNYMSYASLTSLSLLPFPNLINLSLINIRIGNDHCKAILESLRNEKTLETISIRHCETNADLDPLCNEINAERKMIVTVQHGPSPPYSLDHIFGEIKNGAE